MNQQDFIKRIQKRVANTCIGNSTLRNQGAKGVAESARKFLYKLNVENRVL